MPYPVIRRRRSGRGFVLLTVLWIGLGLLMAVSSFLVTARQAALSGRAEIETTRAVELARSGLNVALADLGRIGENLTTSPRDGTPVTLSMAEGQVTYRIWDEAGKLDINAAPVELLRPVIQRLGEGTGVDAFDGSNIAEAIVARRSLRSGMIGSGELSGILADLGLPRDAVDRAAAVLTPYNFTTQVNPTTAPELLLTAIPGLGPSDVQEIIQRRATGRSMPRFGTASVWLSTRSGPIYTVQAEAVMESGLRARMRAVVAAQGLSFRGGLMRYDILEVEIER